MKTVEEYLRHAGECDALARTATSPEQREQIITMAATWRMLAEQRRARLLKEAAETAQRRADTADSSEKKSPCGGGPQGL